jgi:hypothetical protein
MAGGKGGSQTTSVQVPEWLETAAKGNLARADELAKIGYTPYYGPDVAAMTPSQIAAMQGTNAAASAFGLGSVDPMAGMPAAQSFGGMQAYSSGGLYDQALADLQARAPGQFAAMRAPFIDPVTGAQPASPFGRQPLVAPVSGTGASVPEGYGEGYAGFDLGGTPGGGFGGYTGLGDMFNGGGPGAAGNTFSGGPFSGVANAVGISPVGSDGASGMGGGKR